MWLRDLRLGQSGRVARGAAVHSLTDDCSGGCLCSTAACRTARVPTAPRRVHAIRYWTSDGSIARLS
jgi:hypothetical protein